MVGTAGFMAFWVIAATPAGATFDHPGPDRAVARAILRNEVSIRGEGVGEVWNAPLPPPKTLPDDLAYQTAEPLGNPEGEGIPGLPPVDESPNRPPEKDDTEVLRERAVIDYDEDYGEAFCTDQAGGEACGCDCGDCCSPRPPLGDWRNWLRGICWEGWIDQGFTINTLSPRNRSNGTVTFNDRSNDYQLNQLYLRLTRDVDVDGCFLDVGGRLDLLYGTDSIYTFARGLEVRRDLSPKWNAQRYGLSMPQCYMEVFAPWGNGLSVKLGHFYSILGYESVEAPENFFYSHSYVRQYAEPFTETGLLAETWLGPFAIQAGMSRGYDNWEDNNDNLSFLGGLHWESCNRRTNVALCVHAGREQPDPSTNVRTVYSLVIQQKLGRRWECVLQHDYGTEPGAGVDRGVADWYGVNSYLFYTINDCWKAGMRFEWFCDEGGARVPGANQTADYFELCPGINWTPSERMIVRSELRWDWTGTAGYDPFGDGTRSNQLLLDFDVILRF